ncbi:lytic transglycosylase domain-containing protein [Pseudomaricurvus sp.]|uniref:lytic transglycosylase domain-containing protein n=1 Tax=Pseudomaricurvus sp. TaxID=2004510 RepID=UPI003F6AB1CA
MLPILLKKLSSPIARLVLLMSLTMLSHLSTAQDATPQPVDDELRELLKHAIENSDSFEDRFDAEVWLVSKQDNLGKFIKDPEERMDLLQRIHRAARRADLQPEIVLALIEVESHFNRFAVSSAGAQGMMQVMPFWKNEIGHPEDNLTDIDTNLTYGCTILKHYLNKANGGLVEALARYNGSYGQYWYPRRVMDAWEKHWR